MKERPHLKPAYTGILAALTLLNAIMLYCFGRSLSIGLVSYSIYFILSTIIAFYFIFSIKKRNSFWWLLLLLNSYLAVHGAVMCLLTILLRGGYFGG